MTRQQDILAVLFDLDGTLVDTAADFVAVLETLCEEAGHESPSVADIHHTVSSGARALVSLAFSLEPGEAGFEEKRQRLLELYRRQIRQTRAQLYPGMTELLDWLEQNGFCWGVVTNKPRPFSEDLMAALDPASRCAVLVCPEDVSRTKPDPEPLFLACKQLVIEPDQAIYIGDHPRDIEAGQQAGMSSLAAAWGYLPLTPPLESWNADRIIEQPLDIRQWLQHHSHRNTTR